MAGRILLFLRRLKAGLLKPIFRNTRKACEGTHQWTRIDELLQDKDRRRLASLCKSHSIAPLDSLVKGNLICQECGHIAHYNINLNLENLIVNLRAFDA